MLSRRADSARVVLFLLDQVVLALVATAAFHLKKSWIRADPALLWEVYVTPYTVAAPLMGLALAYLGYYRLGDTMVTPAPLRKRTMVRGGFVCLTVLILVSFMVKPATATGQPAPPYSRIMFSLFFVGSSAGLWLSRLVVATCSRWLRSNTRLARVVVFGSSPRMLKLLGVIERSPHMSVEVVGVASGTAPEDLGPRLERDQALALIEQGCVDHVLVETSGLEPGQLDEILRLADREGVSVHITSTLFPSTHLVPTWERFDGVPVLGFVSAELSLGERVAKRLFDVALSGLALAVLAVPMLVLALAIRITSRGPAFFVQQRVGAGGRTFPMLKFRTMVEGAETGTGPVFAVENDARCTPLGRFLRKWNLDELPQLINVLLGHMSLVGPRPERPEFVTGFKRTIPRYAHKHWVKPGITGWAQIHGLRGASTSLHERVDHDIYYIEHWSLMLDIRILMRTLVDGYSNAA